MSQAYTENNDLLYLKGEYVFDDRFGLLYRIRKPFKNELSIYDFIILNRSARFFFQLIITTGSIELASREIARVYNCPYEKAHRLCDAFMGKYKDMFTNSVELSDRDERAYEWAYSVNYPEIDYVNERFRSPLSVTCLLTEACDKRCVYCFYDATESTQMHTKMDLFTAKKVIDECAVSGVQSITFSGGEPMLHPDIVEIIRYCSQKGIRSILATRGGVSPQKAIDVCRSGLNQVTVGLDASNDQIADRIANSNNVATRTIEFIRTAIDSNVLVKVLCIVSKLNYRDIPNMINLCKSLNVHALVFRECANSFGRNDDSILLHDHERDEINAMIENAPQVDFDIHYTKRLMDLCNPTITNIHCRMGRHVMTIRSDAKVVMCDTIISDERLVVGDVKKNSIQEIWDSEAMHSFINPTRQLYANTKCGECNRFAICQKCQCVYASLLATGKLRSPLTNCDYQSL